MRYNTGALFRGTLTRRSLSNAAFYVGWLRCLCYALQSVLCMCVVKDGIHRTSFLNPLRAKFFKGNINIYLHFVSFLHIDTTQVVEILPEIRQEPTYST